MSEPQAPAGWYPDSEGRPGAQRYWDGSQWTEHRHPAPDATTPPPPPSPHANQQPQTIYVQRAGNGFAVAALVCGIVGSILGLIPLLFILAFPLGALAFIFGIVGRRRAKSQPEAGRNGMAWAGIILGVIALALGVAGAVIVDDVTSDLNDSVECLEQADSPSELDDC